MIADVLKGDTEKFEFIVEHFQKPIFRYCYHMLGSDAEAKDSGQEVFLKASRHLHKYSRDLPETGGGIKQGLRDDAGGAF
nr:sigma factor [Paenibacillus hamazuiensis]